MDTKKSTDDLEKKDTGKRNRGDNWSNEEKRELLDLIVPHGNIIENKATDADKNKQKKSAWEDIHANFTARFGNKRSVTQVKVSYLSAFICQLCIFSNTFVWFTQNYLSIFM